MRMNWGLILSLVFFFSLACFGMEGTTPAPLGGHSNTQTQMPPLPKKDKMTTMIEASSKLMPGRSSANSSGSSGSRGVSGGSNSDGGEKYERQYQEGLKRVEEVAKTNLEAFKASLAEEVSSNGSKELSAAMENITKKLSESKNGESDGKKGIEDAYASLQEKITNTTEQNQTLLTALQNQQLQSSFQQARAQQQADRNNPNPLGFVGTRLSSLPDIRPQTNLRGVYSQPSGINFR